MDAETMGAELKRLMGYLASDPKNPALLGDCAKAALAGNELQEAVSLFARLDALEPLSGADANLAGIAAMRSGNQEAAQQWYARALEAMPDDINLTFNIAWSKALAKDFEGAAALLQPEVVEELPQAAMLAMQIDHELGHFEDAEQKLDESLARFPDYAPLHAAASALAMDIDDPDLARQAAERGGEHPDALTTLGTLELGEQKLDEARARFERALELRGHTPRAEIGLGLVDLASGNPATAAARLDKGAEQFGDHLGSWIAAGWAHFVGGDMDAARQRFETALSHDDTFGEAQGSLAVVELLQGEADAARRRIEVARRLDRNAFSVALASILWEQSKGNHEKAQRIFEIAAKQPILPNNSTLMDELVKTMSKS